MLYQRDPKTGLAVSNELLNKNYPPIPLATKFQDNEGYGYREASEIHGWQWSETFGRWGAVVSFPNGWRGLSWPEISLERRNRLSCKILRDAFFGDNHDAVFAAIPDLPEAVFGAAKCKPLVPYAEQLGLIPEGDLFPPEGGKIVYLVGKGDLPYDGPFMEEVDDVPSNVALGHWSIKEEIVAKCIMTGARYGCCWFRKFLH